MNTYLTGNTIRIVVEFFDWTGEPRGVDSIQFIIYDYKYNIIPLDEGVVPSPYLNNENEVMEGKYYLDYTPSNIPQKYIYEFSGDIGGSPSVSRGTFVTKFV